MQVLRCLDLRLVYLMPGAGAGSIVANVLKRVWREGVCLDTHRSIGKRFVFRRHICGKARHANATQLPGALNSEHEIKILTANIS